MMVLATMLACDGGKSPPLHSGDTGTTDPTTTPPTADTATGGSGSGGSGGTPTDDGSLVGEWAGKATAPVEGYSIPIGSGQHYDAFVYCDGYVHVVVDPDPDVPVTGELRCLGGADPLTGSLLTPTLVIGTVTEDGYCQSAFRVERVGLERPVFTWASCINPRLDLAEELYRADGRPVSPGSGGWTNVVPGGSSSP